MKIPKFFTTKSFAEHKDKTNHRIKSAQNMPEQKKKPKKYDLQKDLSFNLGTNKQTKKCTYQKCSF